MLYTINLLHGPCDGCKIVTSKEEKDVVIVRYAPKITDVVGEQLYANAILDEDEHLFMKTTTEKEIMKAFYARMPKVRLDDEGKVVERYYEFRK